MSNAPQRFATLSREAFAAFLNQLGAVNVDGAPAQASRTALITAFIRAFHFTNESPAILSDALAQTLLSEEEYAFFEEMYYRKHLRDSGEQFSVATPRRPIVAQELRQGAGVSVLVRARFAEEALERAVAQGFGQYVALGAGFDSLPWRRKELLQAARVVEIDLPATQRLKRERLAKLGWDAPEALEFLEADFSQESLPAALARSSLDLEAPIFFSWLGVTYYLSLESLSQTLLDLGGAPARLLVFDYLNERALEGDAERGKGVRGAVGRLGEPLQSGLNPNDLPETLRRLGWELLCDLDPSAIAAKCLPAGVEGFHVGPFLHLALARSLGRGEAGDRGEP